MEIQFQERAKEYLQRKNCDAVLGKQLGAGQEGSVWESTRGSALKVFERENNFKRELRCYEILHDFEISSIEGFNIPQLLGADDDLWVIEMTIVSPPYILDFGKAHLMRPDFSIEAIEDYEAEAQDSFGAYWPVVQLALYELRTMGIWYIDANLRNISCKGLQSPGS